MDAWCPPATRGSCARNSAPRRSIVPPRKVNRLVTLDLTNQEVGAAAYRLEAIQGGDEITAEERQRIQDTAAWLRGIQQRVVAELRRLQEEPSGAKSDA
jgi:hypothetical protein